MFPEYVTWGQVWKGGAVVLGRGKMGTAADGSSAEQSWAQTQSISEQMASLVMTARSGPRDSMSLRNSPSSSGLWGIPWKTKHASPFTYQTILYPSSHLSINIQTSLLPHFHGNGETVDLGSHCLAFRSRSSIRNVCSHQMPNIWIIECFAASDKCVLTCSSCLLGRASHVAPGSSVPPQWGWGTSSRPYWEPRLPPVETSSTPMGCFHTVFTEKGIKYSVQKNQEGF